jgi:hypothetical protein
MPSNFVCACALVAALSIPAELGVAKGAPLHQRPWPIRNGFNRQSTQDELSALHQQDVTPDQADEIDRLYDELLASSKRFSGNSLGAPRRAFAVLRHSGQ